MFERFAHDARDAVNRAQTEAEGLRADRIGSAHVLLAAAATPGPASQALDRLGVGTDQLRAAVRAGTQSIDADALSAVGIDLDAVRAQVESTFGAGALDAPRATTSARAPRSFTPDAKKLLEVALREAVRLHHRRIDTGHLLLAAVRLTDSPAHRTLSTLGLDDAAVRDAVASAWVSAA